MSNRKPISLGDDEPATLTDIQKAHEAEEARKLEEARAPETQSSASFDQDDLTPEEKKLQAQGLTTPGDLATGPKAEDSPDFDDAVRGARGEPAKETRKGRKARKQKEKAEEVQAASEKASESKSETPVSVIFSSALTKEQEATLTAARVALADAKSRAEPGVPLSIDPKHLLIVGLDVPDNREDPLHQPDRVAAPVDEQWVEAMNIMGWPANESLLCIERDGAAFIVEGRQRCKTARKVNDLRSTARQEPIRASFVIVSGMPDNDLALIGQALNAYGVDDSPLMKARAAALLMERMGGETAPVSMAMKLTQQGVRDLVAINGLSPQLHGHIDRGDISAAAVLHIARKVPKVEDQVRLVKDLVEAGTTSVAQVKGAVKRELGEVTPSEGNEGGRGGGGDKGWNKGEKPKLRFVEKVIARALENCDPDTKDGEVLDTVIKALRWATAGEPAPRCLSGHITATNNALRG